MTNILIAALIIALALAIVCDIVRISQYIDAKKSTNSKLKARNALLREELAVVIKAYMTSPYGSSYDDICKFIDEYFKNHKQ